jgi:hypothetical protein
MAMEKYLANAPLLALSTDHFDEIGAGFDSQIDEDVGRYDVFTQ